MELNDTDKRLMAALEEGLPLTLSPYADIGKRAGLSEGQVIARLRSLLECGALKRLGLVVNHRELGYTANAMVVWDVPKDDVSRVGAEMSAYPFVTLCYRRTWQPAWPYNLYCMIHGQDRRVVESQIVSLAKWTGLADVPRQVLFSRRRFRQRGARYASLDTSTLIQEVA